MATTSVSCPDCSKDAYETQVGQKIETDCLNCGHHSERKVGEPRLKKKEEKK